MDTTKAEGMKSVLKNLSNGNYGVNVRFDGFKDHL